MNLVTPPTIIGKLVQLTQAQLVNGIIEPNYTDSYDDTEYNFDFPNRYCISKHPFLR